jgi:hypothetical protein
LYHIFRSATTNSNAFCNFLLKKSIDTGTLLYD